MQVTRKKAAKTPRLTPGVFMSSLKPIA
jgi:hypothetical protein